MGQAYTGFAEVYDLFMDNVPYEKWTTFLMEKLSQYGYEPNMQMDVHQYDLQALGVDVDEPGYEENIIQEHNTVLDLGCGTGTLTRMMAAKGFDMIGVDLSEQMLDIAHEKEFELEEPSGVIYLCQDMRELELFGTVGAVVSVCDCINYVLDQAEVTEVFKKVNNYLFPGGLFIFDFNTLHKYRDVIGNTTIAENREQASFIWDNFYHEKECINEYELSIFVKDEYDEDDMTSWDSADDKSDANAMSDDFDNDDFDDDGDDPIPYVRFTETHYQKGYTLAQIKECIDASGLTFLEALDGDTFEAADENSERIFVVARECGKKAFK